MRKLYTAWENIYTRKKENIEEKIFGFSKRYDASFYIFENNFLRDYQRSHSFFNLL